MYENGANDQKLGQGNVQKAKNSKDIKCSLHKVC